MLGSAGLMAGLSGPKVHFQPKQLHYCRVFQAPGTCPDAKAMHCPSSEQESVAGLLKDRRELPQQPLVDKL